MRRRHGLALSWLAVLAFLGCGGGDDTAPPGGAPATSITTGAGAGGVGGGGGAGGAGGATPVACQDIAAGEALQIAVAPAADEYALALPASAASRTSWAEPGNEALVLEVRKASGLIGHLVLHQGADPFPYTMQLGHLDAGEEVMVQVSPLSAAAATQAACVGPAALTPAATLGGDAEGLLHAPIMKWPVQKRFDDLPIVVGWSRQRQRYEMVYTNENGGTVALCGGGAEGIEAEIARWSRAADIEGLFSYGGASPVWQRCTGATAYASITPRVEALHPILYYGDGHNRLFESRGGYGQTCGTSGDNRADGDLAGWNTQNPGNDEALDADVTVTIRPLPVDLDALGYADASGRREALIDRYAPWLYRLTGAELEREGKIDQQRTFPMQQYLYADVLAADVGGSGDNVCAVLGVSGGFVLRLNTAAGTRNGPQMTADYFGGDPGWKRIAIPLDQVYTPAQLQALVFDAYDNDGIYWLALGDVFIPRPSGDNGATLEYLHQGVTEIDVYVDDDSSSCAGGTNSDGPDGTAYPCVGSFHPFDL